MVSFSIGEAKEPVTLYDRNGRWLFEDPVQFPKAFKSYTQDAAVTGSETAVVAASAAIADGTVVDLVAEIGKQGILRTIRTTPFYPRKVCSTDNGTVWVFGSELTADRTREAPGHYFMLREYSFDRGQLRSDLDRVTFRPPLGIPVSGAREEVQLRCGSGEVVLISGVTNEVIEYDLETSRLVRRPLAALPDGFYINGAAVTDSGEVYVSAFRPGKGAQTGILHLHADSAGIVEWEPVSLGPVAERGKWFILLGSDGEDLVYSKGRQAPRLFWSRGVKE